MSEIDAIRKRHEAILFIDWDKEFDPEAQPLSNSNARQCHADRAYLLERIAELKAKLDAANAVAKAYVEQVDELEADLEAETRTAEGLQDALIDEQREGEELNARRLQDVHNRDKRIAELNALLDEIAEWVTAHVAGEFEYTRTKYMADQLQAILNKREQDDE